ncbi:MAG TPA: thermonuclease family protein [Solirubrobacterales bacterium]|nr:thermonuclease family protein [Solirubrobacterales bacterium]
MRLGRSGPSLGALALLVVLVAVLVSGGEDPERTVGVDPEGDEVTATVTRVVDGDTVAVEIDGSEDSVRYIGVDTPESVAPGEPVECFGPEASRFNARLVEGEEIRLVFDAERRDRYGRLLAYVYAGDVFVNAELIRRGFATTLTIPPNDSFADRFERLADRASEAGRGLWGAC